jgi:hypothetical protein
MTVAILVVVSLTLLLLLWLGWVASNIRDDQMIIRTWIANQVRMTRAQIGAPVEDEAFYRWLRDHPDRPRRDDPPIANS